MQPEVVASPDGFFLNIVPSRRDTSLYPLNRQVRGIEPEVQDGDIVAVRLSIFRSDLAASVVSMQKSSFLLNR